MKRFLTGVAMMAGIMTWLLVGKTANAEPIAIDKGKVQGNVDGWDKVFPLSDKVNHAKVTFKNHFGITLMADVYTPKGASGSCPPSP